MSKLAPFLEDRKEKRVSAAASSSFCKINRIENLLKKIETASAKAEKYSLAAIISEPVGTSQELVTATVQPISSSPTHAVEASAHSQDSASAPTTFSFTSDTERQKFAASLIDPKFLLENYFSKIIDDSANTNMKEDKAGTTEAGTTMKGGKYQVYNLPIKLILSPFMPCGRQVADEFACLLETHFGPLHAALQVGNVVLEWNNSSLVAPYFCSQEDQVTGLDMQPRNQWVKHTKQQHSTLLKSTAKNLDFSEKILLFCKSSSEQTSLINALIQVIIRYNKYCYFSVHGCNCQHFLCQVLKTLDVELPEELLLPWGLGEYYKDFKWDKKPTVPLEFATHADLDEYVMLQEKKGVIEDMLQQDLEFLLATYFRFHLESESGLRGNRKMWQCLEKNCCIEKIENLIKIESMIIHQYGRY